jgi:hypothetical protein
MRKYKWYAVWKYDNAQYLCIDDGDAENGMCEPIAYVGDEPTYFRTKEACRKWMREWLPGTFIIKKRED